MTRRNLERMNIPEEQIKNAVKFDSKHCPKNYCNVGCKGAKNKKLNDAGLIKNGFFKNLNANDIEKFKSLGALSSCQPFKTVFIKGTPEEVKKGWNILKDF